MGRGSLSGPSLQASDVGVSPVLVGESLVTGPSLGASLVLGTSEVCSLVLEPPLEGAVVVSVSPLLVDGRVDDDELGLPSVEVPFDGAVLAPLVPVLGPVVLEAPPLELELDGETDVDDGEPVGSVGPSSELEGSLLHPAKDPTRAYINHRFMPNLLSFAVQRGLSATGSEPSSAVNEVRP